jgi:hypothetical protein
MHAVAPFFGLDRCGGPSAPSAPASSGARSSRRFDANGDGRLGPDARGGAARGKLRHLDRDRDGWVEPGAYR